MSEEKQDNTAEVPATDLLAGTSASETISEVKKNPFAGILDLVRKDPVASQLVHFEADEEEEEENYDHLPSNMGDNSIATVGDSIVPPNPFSALQMPSRTPFQDIVDETMGYLMAMEMEFLDNDQCVPKLRLLFPDDWQLLQSLDYTFQLEAEVYEGLLVTCRFTNFNLKLDDMFAFILQNIRYNRAIEAKRREIEELQRQTEIRLQAEIAKMRSDFQTPFQKSEPIAPQPVAQQVPQQTGRRSIRDMFQANKPVAPEPVQPVVTPPAPQPQPQGYFPPVPAQDQYHGYFQEEPAPQPTRQAPHPAPQPAQSFIPKGPQLVNPDPGFNPNHRDSPEVMRHRNG